MEIVPFIPIVLLSWAACLWHAYCYGSLGRLVRRQTASQGNTQSRQAVSIIIPVHDHSAYLRNCLPLLLGQDYEAPFEVIVVDQQSSDETLSLLEDLEQAYPHLLHTLCPASARDISMQRLALTLGVRLAQYDWVVFLQAGCQPADAHWLSAFTAPFDEQSDAVLGISVLEPSGRWRVRCMQFHRLWHQMMWLPSRQRTAPFHGDPACLAYRRSLFFLHQGFASSALLTSGAEALLLNHNVPAARCAVSIARDAILRQKAPHPRVWTRERTFFVETRHHQHHLLGTRLRYAARLLAPPLFLLSGVLLCWLSWPMWQVTAAVVALWFILALARQYSFHLTTQALGLPAYIFTLPLLRHRIPRWDIASWLRWRSTDKRTFRRKFV